MKGLRRPLSPVTGGEGWGEGVHSSRFTLHSSLFTLHSFTLHPHSALHSSRFPAFHPDSVISENACQSGQPTRRRAVFPRAVRLRRRKRSLRSNRPEQLPATAALAYEPAGRARGCVQARQKVAGIQHGEHPQSRSRDPVAQRSGYRLARVQIGGVSQASDHARRVSARSLALRLSIAAQGRFVFVADPEDVKLALEAGVPAARVYDKPLDAQESHPEEVRIAFDGDAVLFSDQAERVYQERGLPAFEEHERSRAAEPLPPGPLQPFLRALHSLQKSSPRGSPMRIRTALVTARSAPAHDRAVRTLMSWDIEVDEAMFLGGLEKGPFLRVFEPDFYFDDQLSHVQSAIQACATGHVDAGMINVMPLTQKR